MPSIWDKLEAQRLSTEVSGPTMRATPENPMQRWIRQGAIRLADAVGGANTQASRTIEEGLTGVGDVLAGGLEPGGPEKAGLVLSARNMPKLRAAMEVALKGKERTPENVALAFSKAKYPKLSNIPDYMIGENTYKIPSNKTVRGQYNPYSNTAAVYTNTDDKKTSDFVNTIMHEAQHARQAYRKRPTEYANPETGEITVSPVARVRAKVWDKKYMNYELQSDIKAVEYNELFRRETAKGHRMEDPETWRYNLYKWDNPYERQAFKAGDTAESTYKMFQRFDTFDRPGQRARLTDRVRDWLDNLLK